jgi:N-acetyl-anhydromuramyl-L-alanine amidase AmpD
MDDLRIRDVRSQMPTGAHIAAAKRMGAILGVAIHHSASAHPASGLSIETAHSIFLDHVQNRGWEHGGYHYVIRPNGEIEYALDETVAGYHAGFNDPTDALQLERGQFWNQHYLGVCAAGWFDNDRQYKSAEGQAQPIPNRFTRPTEAQWRAVVGLAAQLCERYAIPTENVRGHRELSGCRTRCPGANFDLEALRAAVSVVVGARHSPAA